MDDPVRVGIAGAREDLADDLHRLRHAEAAIDQVLERSPLHVLHRDVVAAVDGAPVEHPDHVGVLEARGRRGLAPESLDELLILREALVEELERDAPIEHRVLGAPDVRHPAGAELADQPVPPRHHRLGRELH